MSAHTPGPWVVGQSGDDYVVAGQWAGVKGGRRVMSIRTGVIPSPSDARLIAAAPALLEALEDVIAYVEPSSDAANAVYDKARVAIALAKGESHV